MGNRPRIKASTQECGSPMNYPYLYIGKVSDDNYLTCAHTEETCKIYQRQV